MMKASNNKNLFKSYCGFYAFFDCFTMKGLEMVKCESLRINMYRITHTGKISKFSRNTPQPVRQASVVNTSPEDDQFFEVVMDTPLYARKNLHHYWMSLWYSELRLIWWWLNVTFRNKRRIRAMKTLLCRTLLDTKTNLPTRDWRNDFVVVRLCNHVCNKWIKG